MLLRALLAIHPRPPVVIVIRISSIPWRSHTAYEELLLVQRAMHIAPQGIKPFVMYGAQRQQV